MENKTISYITLISALIGMLMLSGCTQTVPSDSSQFYLLSSNSQANSKTGSEHIIGLRPVAVASYIDNPGIALQTSDNRIRIANHHLWAEEPNLAITRVLHGELNNLLPTSRVDNGQLGRNTDWQYTLSTHIDQFHGTEEGLAIFSGYWRFESKNGVLINSRFNLSSTLEQPGYTELVAQLRLLLTQLAVTQATQITQTLDQ